MKLVTVIPIARTIGRETLTYFSSKDFPAGSIVSIPLRKKMVNALVTGTEDVTLSKADVKNAAFQIKKITEASTRSFFLPAFIKAAENTSNYFAVPTGAIISSLTPAPIFNELLPNKKKSLLQDSFPKPPVKTKTIEYEKLLFQADDEERIASYKSLIREEFAKKRSVFFCVPTIQDIKRFANVLVRGIDNYTFIFHSELSKKELIATWNNALASKHSILIIGTPLYLSFPRHDVKTIILEFVA